MNILLMGGTGAIGVPLVNLLASRGDEVYVTSRSQHSSVLENVHYLQGNVHDDIFLDEVLSRKYDTIVDFMIYDPEEFVSRVKKILNNTEQYVFLSSSRVYAYSDAPLTEDSPRLLDVCTDDEYMATNEYALAKAREENILFGAERQNWTIVRPYITYNTERLQLGGIEKELWLSRALRGNSIPLPKDVGSHQTTLTYGEDVARAMTYLIGQERAYGEVFHITGAQSITWNDVAAIYKNTLEKTTGTKIHYYMPDSSTELSIQMNNNYQIRYDRLYNRCFDNSKIKAFTGENFLFTPIQDGLSRCLREFIEHPRWLNVNVRAEAYLDRKSKEKTNLRFLPGSINKIKYYSFFYFPLFMERLGQIRSK